MNKPQKGSPRASLIILSATAERHAAKHGHVATLADLSLPQSCAVGDLVQIADMDLVILRRRWRLDDDQPLLEVTLDYPARSGAR